MSAPSHRRLALGDLEGNPEALASLVAEDETLFVEHKTDIAKGEAYQLAKASASFANTLGGWILVGVKNGKPLAGWEPPTGVFVDVVRQRLEGRLDPLPSFAARVLTHNDRKIGVIRVYESTDTPHILAADGAVVIREPAQDSKLRKQGRYEATPIRSHYELLQLTRRGADAQTQAAERFKPGARPWIDASVDLRWTMAATRHGTVQTVHSEVPALILRLSVRAKRRRINCELPCLRRSDDQVPSDRALRIAFGAERSPTRRVAAASSSSRPRACEEPLGVLASVGRRKRCIP